MPARTATAGEPVSRARTAAGGSGSRTGSRGAARRPAASPPPKGPCPEGRIPLRPPPVGVLPATALPTKAPPAAPGARGACRPAAPAYDRDNNSHPGLGVPMTCTDSRCGHQPPGLGGGPRGRSQASRTALPAGRRTAASASPAAARTCQARSPAGPAPAPVLPRKPALRALAGPCPGAASSPVRPPIGHRLRGAVATPDQLRSRADLAGQPSHGTGHGPDLCRYRQPGATGCRACRMFPIACYGLTPRCREVKR